MKHCFVLPLFLFALSNYLCNYLIAAQSSDDFLLKRRLTTGTIIGKKLVTARNATAYAFMGIPYAEAPVGNLRFRAPVSKKAWSGTLKADKFGAPCHQQLRLPGTGVMNEDCLFINILTSERCLRTKKCPVMYYVFGGAWNIGFPAIYDFEFLTDSFASKDIVLTMAAYRVNVFGFFNTGSKGSTADQNVGLQDMVEGLRWVQREIDTFGGDRKRVSIMGHSSGAEAVELLALSPRTAGLFHQFIVMSAPMSMPPLSNATNVQQSKILSIEAKCATESSWEAGGNFREILACLRKTDANLLLNIFQRMIFRNISLNFLGPTIDGRGGFLPDTVAVMHQSRRPHPCLTGTTNMEFRFSRSIIQNGVVNQTLLRTTCENLARQRSFKYPVEIGEACAKEYAREPETIPDLTDDDLIYLPTYERGEYLRHQGVKVFKYSFEYDKIGNATVEVGLKSDKSPSHDQDLVYVMGLKKGYFTAKDKSIRQIYTSAFVNFIKTGDPSMISASVWQPTDDRNNYFKINFDENLVMPGNTNGYHEHAVKFWIQTAPQLDKELALKRKSAKIDSRALERAALTSLEDARHSIYSLMPNGFMAIVVSLFGFIFIASMAVWFVKGQGRPKGISGEIKPLNSKVLKTYSSFSG